MHRLLKDLLPKAKGESQFVVAAFIDVRGFSSWMTESSEAAVFLRRAYSTIIEQYFPTASFFKPTGDGLLVVLTYNEDSEASLRDAVQQAVRASVELVRAFPKITDGDPMINFPVPTELGVGLARGAATALISDDKVLDYSGRPLNLAARLMDLARPSGLVFSENLGIELLEQGLVKRFSRRKVYVRSLAEDEPIGVYYSKKLTNIPNLNRHPLSKLVQRTQPRTELTLKRASERGAHFAHRLTSEPADKKKIKLNVRYKRTARGGRQHPTLWRLRPYKATYVERAGQKFAWVDYNKIVADLRAEGVKSTWPVTVQLEYPVREL